MAFPIEGWATSAAVLVRQAADGTVSGEVHGAPGQEEPAWKQALAVLSLDVDGTGFADVGRRDTVIGGLTGTSGTVENASPTAASLTVNQALGWGTGASRLST